MSHFQGATSLDRRDQCVYFEPLVDHIGKGPPTVSQPGVSELVIGGPKTFDTMVQDNPKINGPHNPA